MSGGVTETVRSAYLAATRISATPGVSGISALWATATSIPAQSAGAWVYYRITATNDVPEQTVSDEMSYNLPVAVTIEDIQGLGTFSSYVGDAVTTNGVVTADFGSTFVIQDGTGQRTGLWVEGVEAPALGTLVEVSGIVQELDSNTTPSSVR